MKLSSRTLFAGIAVVSVAAVAAALVSQHRFDMLPCAFCVLQRLIFIGIALAALLGLWSRRLGAALVVALGFSGLWAALWQHFIAARSESCNLTFADRFMTATQLNAWFPDVFQAWASCADAAVQLLGLPYEAWSGALFTVMALLGLRILRA